MVANTTHSRMSHIQTTQVFFCLLKVHDPSYPVLMFGGNLSSKNGDMSQNLILQGCERSNVIRDGQNIFCQTSV